MWLAWAVLSTLFWGIWGLASAKAGHYGTALGVMAGAVAVEALVVFWAWPQVKESFSWWMVAAGCSAAIGYAALFLALKAGGPAGPVFALTATYPAVVAILAFVFLGDSLTTRQFAGIGLAIGAGVLLSWE